MGIKCSRQGYIQDFHDFGDTRLAPEGQSFPADFLRKENELGMRVPSPVLQQRLAAILTDEKLAKRLSASLSFAKTCEKRENVLVGEETTCFMNNTLDDLKLVDLPPEGKVACDQEFVELPVEKINKCDHDVEVVDLPILSCHNEELLFEANSSMWKSDSQKLVDIHSEDEHVLSNNNSISLKGKGTQNKMVGRTMETTDDDQWLYTLYDFEGKGLVTKQDVNRLMDSICSVVGNTIVSDPVNEQDGTDNSSDNLKVHLEIGRRKSNKKTVKSPNKYLPSKQYKGMIFPPPNSEEAEKISSYIEEKILIHRRRMSRKHDDSASTRHYEGESKTSMHACSSCNQNASRHRKDDKTRTDLYPIPKRKNTCGDEHRRTTIRTQPTVHRSRSNYDGCETNVINAGSSDNSLSPSLSGTNTPQSCDEVFHYRNHHKEQQQNGAEKRRASAEETGNMLRFRHSCSCHHKSKLKGCDNIYTRNSKHIYTRNSKHERESKLCKQIKLSARKQLSAEQEYDKNSIDSSHVKCSSSKISSDSSSEYENIHSRTNNIKKLYNEDRNNHRKATTRRFITDPINETLPTASSSQRPAVWPGCSSSIRDVSGATDKSFTTSPPSCSKSSATSPPSCSSTIVSKCVTSSNTLNKEQLCFCKRMLGISYPCNHATTTTITTASSSPTSKPSNTVHHKHKHEHHHFHYYVQRDTITCSID